MGRPELLVIDLDGTLLGSEGVVSPENHRAIDRARAEGMEIIIATGRALCECGDILRSIDYAGPLIAAGGSLMVDAVDGRTLARYTIAAGAVATVVDCIEQHQATPLVLKDRHATGVDYLLVGDGELHPVSTWWFGQNEAICQRVECLADDPSPDDTVRIGAVGSPEEFEPMARELNAIFGEALTVRHWPAVTSSAHAEEVIHLLEVFEPRADKWTMVEDHCARAGVATNRVCAVGDGLNDVMVVEGCGLGVAMGNAHGDVLAVADMVTGSHHEHGVADLVHGLLDGRIGIQA